MPLDEVFKVIESDDYDFEGWLNISETSFQGSSLTAKLIVGYEASKKTKQFELKFTSVIKYCFVPESGGSDLELTGDHPLLWDYCQDLVLLGFNSKAEDSLRLISDLYLAHSKASGGWIPFNRYLNPEIELPQLLKGGFGKLAEGPSSLMNTYKEVLDAHGLKTSYYGIRKPTYWDPSDHSFHEYCKAPQILLVNDLEYVIFGQVEAKLL